MIELTSHNLIENIKSLKKGSEINFDQNLESLKQLNSYEDIGVVVDAILSFCLTPREHKVLMLRKGILTGNISTLEAIGKNFDVTRERIRQIEAKALRKLQHPNKSIYLEGLLLNHKENLIAKLLGPKSILNSSYYKDVSLLLLNSERFLIESCYGSFTGYMKKNFRNIDSFWMKELILSKKDFDNLKLFQAGISFKKLVQRAEEESCWPVTIKQISEKTLFSEFIVERYYKLNKGLEVEDGEIKLKSMKATQELTYILREIGSAASTVNIWKQYELKFNKKTNLHRIDSALGRMKGALIVDRGSYNLYENMSFTSEDLKEIRDRCEEYLLTVNEYTSSKVIYKKLFVDIKTSYNQPLTHYMVHGILQDDSRFTIRRGLMVGLKSKVFTGVFSSLTDEVLDLIKEKGPISELDVLSSLGDSRDIFGINNIIYGSDEVCRTQEPLEGVKYDSVDRVFGDESKQQELSDSMQINLFRGELTPHEFIRRLNSVSFNQNSLSILSMAMKQDNISSSFKNKKLNLLKISNKDQKINDYILGKQESTYFERLDSYSEIINFNTNYEQEELFEQILWNLE